MRLTLRTLLAYLDDTLEPGEIKNIGQKVAESDSAQELIARIKQITRRRRLTTPPLNGPGAKFDANTVAEYLDNDLPADLVAELEKTCLESDVHLAEIASCHQILTLILGEPALVPPTAKERMYQLVHGREAIPYRKAPSPVTTSPSGSHHELEPDESPLLGLPFFRRPSWTRWALPAAALVLVVGLGIAIWMALPGKPTPYTPGQQAAVTDPGKPKTPDKDPAVENKDRDKEAEKERLRKQKEEEERKQKEAAEREKAREAERQREMERQREQDREAERPRIGRRPPRPLEQRVAFASVMEPARGKSVLISRQRDQADAPFKRLAPESTVYTNDTIVCLPGYTAQFQTKSVGVTMRGNLPEFGINPLMDFLLEAELVLHAPPEGIDLDLTLDRGRIYLANNKEGKDAVVRLRFVDQVWDLTLKPDAEVGVDLIKKYVGDIDFRRDEPWSGIALCAMQSKVEVKYNYQQRPVKLEGPPGAAVLQWDSLVDQPPTPIQVPELPFMWSKMPPLTLLNKQKKMLGDVLQTRKPEEAQEIKYALAVCEDHINRARLSLAGLDDLANLINSDKKSVGLTLVEELQAKEPDHRHLAIYFLGAIGELETLLSAMTDDDPDRFAEREEAVMVLRRFVSRGLEPAKALFADDGGKKTGLLVKKYGEKDGEKVFTMLHDFKEKDLVPATFEVLTRYLKSDRMAVRMLAHWHLIRLAGGIKLPAMAMAYNPADPVRQRRDEAAGEWQQLVIDGKLPPKR